MGRGPLPGGARKRNNPGTPERLLRSLAESRMVPECLHQLGIFSGNTYFAANTRLELSPAKRRNTFCCASKRVTLSSPCRKFVSRRFASGSRQARLVLAMGENFSESHSPRIRPRTGCSRYRPRLCGFFPQTRSRAFQSLSAVRPFRSGPTASQKERLNPRAAPLPDL